MSASESPTAVFEHSFYIGNYMSGILYGVELVMYYLTVKALRARRSSPGSANTFFLIYNTILLLLLTADISVNAVWAENMWITDRDTVNEKGLGVAIWLGTNIAAWYQALGSATVVAMIFMGDALLIWRLYVVFSSNIYIIILPCLMYLTAFILSIIELVAAFAPGGNFFAGKSVTFGVPYYALTISMNLLVTLLICVRLFYLSERVKRALGAESAKIYTSVAAILVESALPYSLVGIMFLVPYARGSDTAISFGQVWAKLACLAPQFIIYRVANGHAWQNDTASRVESSLAFQSGKPNTLPVDSVPYHSEGTTLTQGSRGLDSEKGIEEA